MHDTKMLIFQAMINTGRLSETDRIEIVEYVHSGDYARVGITAFHRQKKIPFMYWNVCVNTACEEGVWETTTCYTI